MNIYIPLSVIIVLLLYIVRNSKKLSKSIYRFVFMLLFVFSAIRYDFGPDYMNYLSIFKETKQYGYDSHYSIELLFGWFLSIFPNYSSYIVISTALWFGSLYLLFTKFVEYRYYWVLFAFLLFTEACIIDSYVAMRSALSMVLYVLAFMLLQNGKRLFAVLFGISSVFIHISSIVLLPLFLINDKTKLIFKNKGFILVALVLGVGSVIVGKSVLINQIITFAMANAEDAKEYARYLDDSVSSISLNAIVLRILCFIPLYSLYKGIQKEQDTNYRILFQYAIIAILLPLFFGMGMTTRFLMILNPFYIVALLRAIKYQKIGLSFITFTSVFVVSFYMLFHSMTQDYNVTFLMYKTIFSAPSIP